jgi:hypothetical protein
MFSNIIGQMNTDVNIFFTISPNKSTYGCMPKLVGSPKSLQNTGKRVLQFRHFLFVSAKGASAQRLQTETGGAGEERPESKSAYAISSKC